MQSLLVHWLSGDRHPMIYIAPVLLIPPFVRIAHPTMVLSLSRIPSSFFFSEIIFEVFILDEFIDPFFAAVNVLALSGQIIYGLFLLATSLFSALMSSSVVCLVNISKWMVLETLHLNNSMDTFSSPFYFIFNKLYLHNLLQQRQLAGFARCKFLAQINWNWYFEYFTLEPFTSMTFAPFFLHFFSVLASSSVPRCYS